MHSLSIYSLVTSDKCIQHHDQEREQCRPPIIPRAPLLSISLPTSVTTDLLSVAIVLPFLESHRNEIIQYVGFCVWFLSLSTMPLRLIDIVI